MPKKNNVMIIVVGTNHTTQMSESELQLFLENLCRNFDVRAIAEEMSG